MPDTLPPPEAVLAAGPGFGTLETVFEALGRVLVVLDRDFRVIRASHTLDDLAFPGAVAAAMTEAQPPMECPSRPILFLSTNARLLR